MPPLEQLIANYGYYAVLAGALLEGETIIALAGYAARLGYLRIENVMLIAAIGTTVSDQTWFQVGRRFGPTVLQRFPRAARALPRFDAFALRYPALVVILVRFMYGLRIAGPVALCAGRMPTLRFALLNMLGAAIWAVAVAGAGYLLGSALDALIDDARRVQYWAALLIVVIALAIALAVRLRRRRRQQR